MHACACGFYGDATRECRCTPALIQRYFGKISGPLLDRIDIHVEVPAVPYQELRGNPASETSEEIRARVERAVTRVDAIKIDVEGAEYLVLRGARQTLNRFHPMLLVEIVEHQLRAMNTSSTELRDFLQANGYREGRQDGGNVEFLPTTP